MRKSAGRLSQPKPVTVIEAGRKGGLTTLNKLGRGWFTKIGAKGQRVLRSRYPGMAREWGKKGGRPKKSGLFCMRETDK